MRTIKIALIISSIILTGYSCNEPQKKDKADNENENGMIIRISEIEVDPEYLAEYKMILNEEAQASMRLEPGVIAIYPMQEQENPSRIRILEIYIDEDAYKSHLKTVHFQKYKTTTIEMVKSLKLVDMTSMDRQTMSAIFRKLE